MAVSYLCDGLRKVEKNMDSKLLCLIALNDGPEFCTFFLEINA